MGVPAFVSQLHDAERIAAEAKTHGLGVHGDRRRALEGALGQVAAMQVVSQRVRVL